MAGKAVVSCYLLLSPSTSMPAQVQWHFTLHNPAELHLWEGVWTVAFQAMQGTGRCKVLLRCRYSASHSPNPGFTLWSLSRPPEVILLNEFLFEPDSGQKGMVLSCTMRGSSWKLGDISIQKKQSGIGTVCPHGWWNHHSWRYFRKGWT